MKNNRCLKIILANAPVNNGNRGCVALTVSDIYLIDSILSSHGVEYELYLTDSGFEDEQVHSLDIGGKTVVFKAFNNPLPGGIRSFIRSLMHPGRLIRSLKVFLNADYVLSSGQGDSFSDIYGVFRFNLIDRAHSAAYVFRKKLCLLPQTIGPFNSDSVRKSAARSISYSGLVMARDSMSAACANELAKKSVSIKEYIDVAFGLPYELQSFPDGRVHVGLNISALLWNGGYEGHNQFGLKDDYRLLNRRIIEFFLSTENVTLHLVPHVVLQERSRENDYEVCYDLWRKYGNDRITLAPFFPGPIEAKSYISGMDFFVGARMHSTIAAFSSGVPTVPLAYSRKFIGMYEDSLNYHHVADLRYLNNDDIMAMITSAFSARVRISEEVQEINHRVVAERLDGIRADLSSFFELD